MATSCQSTAAYQFPQKQCPNLSSSAYKELQESYSSICLWGCDATWILIQNAVANCIKSEILGVFGTVRCSRAQEIVSKQQELEKSRPASQKMAEYAAGFWDCILDIWQLPIHTRPAPAAPYTGFRNKRRFSRFFGFEILNFTPDSQLSAYWWQPKQISR